MPTASMPRKQALRIALAVAGRTQTDLATEYGVTPSHLSQVIAGKRESISLLEKIDRFIAENLPDQAA